MTVVAVGNKAQIKRNTFDPPPTKKKKKKICFAGVLMERSDSSILINQRENFVFIGTPKYHETGSHKKQPKCYQDCQKRNLPLCQTILLKKGPKSHALQVSSVNKSTIFSYIYFIYIYIYRIDLPSSSCVNTTVRIHYMNGGKT